MREQPRRMERMVPVQYEYRPHRPRGVNFISPCLKYTMFFFNFIFWLVGGALIGIGLYALVDQFQSGEGLRVNEVADVLFNVGLIIAIIGAVIFFVSFFGCIGALRENCVLLKAYSVALLIFFLLELAVATLCFVYPNRVEGIISNYLTDNVIQKYREDPDLQNLIDFVQQEFHCCGLSSRSYEDWSKNEYFNCTSPELNQSVERCGVPYSCCKNATDMSSGLINIMCGYGVQGDGKPSKELLPQSKGSASLHNDANPKEKVWTQGCIDALKSWINRNLYIVASSTLGIALMQLFVMYLAKSLEGQIELQKST
ncbi:unnamed protein product [Allacma fusca]|uniref:Tetraspanin-33 n=1 Tax=Allacma fusca TaxID=39272 RepID=A0A8J2K3Z4_9HEXA|nr:unnamed protein product [Allacma fusca]